VLNETYSRVHRGKNLSDIFSIQYGLKQGDALSPLLFNFALEYAIRRFHKNQKGMKLKGTHQLLAYGDDINLMAENIDTIKKTTEALLDTSKMVGLEVNPNKSKYTLMTYYQNAEQTIAYR
jgi:hypothetical protein